MLYLRSAGLGALRLGMSAHIVANSTDNDIHTAIMMQSVCMSFPPVVVGLINIINLSCLENIVYSTLHNHYLQSLLDLYGRYHKPTNAAKNFLSFSLFPLIFYCN